MEERDKQKFEYSPEPPSYIEGRTFNLQEVTSNTDLFQKSDNLLGINTEDEETEQQTRISGNSKTVLQVLNQDNVQKEIFCGTHKDMLDDSESRDAHQNTIGCIVNNLEEIDCHNNEDTLEYNKSQSTIEWDGPKNSHDGIPEKSIEMLSSDSCKEIAVSRETCIPLKRPTSSLHLTNNPDESKERNSNELDEVSAKLMARIKQMRSQKKESTACKQLDYNNSKDQPFNLNSPMHISPMENQNIKLETVNEQDEILHQNLLTLQKLKSAPEIVHNMPNANRRAVAQILQQQKEREVELLQSFKTQISHLKEMLKKEIAIKFVLLERSKNLQTENSKLRDLFDKKNILDHKRNLKDVSCQVSIGSSCMANQVTNRGSIGKFYKEMFPNNSKNKPNPEIKVEIQPEPENIVKSRNQNEFEKDPHSNKPSIQESVSQATIGLSAEKLKKIKTQSTNPRLRRRSRMDRIKSKSKKPARKDFAPETTIIVIQKTQENQQSYTRQIEDFNCLEEEIQKIKEGTMTMGTSKTKYKSENRARPKTSHKNQPFLHSQKKGKPPLVSPTSQDKRKYSQIPRLGEKRESVKSKRGSHASSACAMNSHKSSRTNSRESKQNMNRTRRTKDASNAYQKRPINPHPSSKNNGIEDLIEQKKQALGIKPLDSSMKNYKQVLNENKKLQKIVEEQKQKLRKMRKERVQQVQEMKKEIEEKKKLEQYIKRDTPLKGRKNRSGYRKESRELSNASNDSKIFHKSPNYRYKSEYTKSNTPITDDFKLYGLESCDSEKKTQDHNRCGIQQPKIGGREYSEIISAEILKKSSKQLLQTSFNNPEKIGRIYKMEKYENDYEKTLTNFDNNPLTKSVSYCEPTTAAENTQKAMPKSLKKSFKNESILFSPNKTLGQNNRKDLQSTTDRRSGKNSYNKLNPNPLHHKIMNSRKKKSNYTSPTKFGEEDNNSVRKGSEVLSEEGKNITARNPSKGDLSTLKFHTIRRTKDLSSKTSLSNKKIYRMSNKSRASDRSLCDNEGYHHESSLGSPKMDSTGLLKIPEGGYEEAEFNTIERDEEYFLKISKSRQNDVNTRENLEPTCSFGN
ncbi:unnamed protein product [Moneuplotes crassus]|uniref:Uncharacterized protein n=1 Tax=Euplotes crassus TaxID=5936 RepID=A0AAD2CVL0_EUPCR|nr:unnamed protein product [Moneuplotes crassus]